VRDRAGSFLLIGLLCLAKLLCAHALVSMVWREAILSWDNPATQIVDELSSQSVSYTDATSAAHERVGLFAAGRRLAAARAADRLASPAPRPGLTRSPPPA